MEHLCQEGCFSQEWENRRKQMPHNQFKDLRAQLAEGHHLVTDREVMRVLEQHNLLQILKILF